MERFVDAESYSPQLEDNVHDNYKKFRDAEGVPVHTGFYAEDVNELATEPWDRTGQSGALVNLYGCEGINDVHLHELSPGGETTVQRHLYDELVYVSSGSGLTIIDPEGDETVFEWNQHSLFHLPSDVPYKHVNTTADRPARLVAQTPLPQLMNIFMDESIIFDVDRRPGRVDDEYFAPSSELEEPNFGIFKGQDAGRIAWNANFIPNVNEFEDLDFWDKTGALKTVFFPMPNSGMYAHIGELPVGQYKNAHRHSPGANIVVLSGEGYSLLWRDDMNDPVRVDWQAGSMFPPPARWYHQHFNLGDEPTRNLALHNIRIGRMNESRMFDPSIPENMIEYTDEHPLVRETFERGLADRGREFLMPEACFTDPDFDFSQSDRTA